LAGSLLTSPGTTSDTPSAATTNRCGFAGGAGFETAASGRDGGAVEGGDAEDARVAPGVDQ